MKTTKENFRDEIARFNDFFNNGVYDEFAQRSTFYKYGRLEINARIFSGDLEVVIYKHPFDTPLETEVFYKDCETMDEAVEVLKVEEEKYLQMK